jgi:phasin
MPSKQENTLMTDTTIKSKDRPGGSLSAAFEEKIESPRLGSPNLEGPRSDIPTVEVPAAFREFAETGISQTREVYERLKKGAEQATAVLEATCAKGGKGATEYGSKLIEIMHANTDAAFDFADELMSVKSFSEMIELSAKHTRKQLEVLADQTKELTALAQKVAAEASEPMKSSVSNALGKDR